MKAVIFGKIVGTGGDIGTKLIDGMKALVAKVTSK